MSMLTDKIARVWTRVQLRLFPTLTTRGIPLSPALQRLAALLELLRVEEAVPPRPSPCPGVRPRDRGLLLRAFVAKAWAGEALTKAWRQRLLHEDALRQLIGWERAEDVPSEATFSRAFRAFAEWEVFDTLHATRVQEAFAGDYCWVQVVDGTALPARERPVVGVPRGKHPPSRLPAQRAQVPEVARLFLPQQCDVGRKPNSHGQLESWIGYKLHLAVTEAGIPLAAVTTAASVHDSQVVLSVLGLTARRVTSLYVLLDRGYDAHLIAEAIRAQGQVPVIDGRVAPPTTAFQQTLYRRRTVVERALARLKDEFALTRSRLRGVRKIQAYAMCSVLVLFADILLRLGA